MLYQAYQGQRLLTAPARAMASVAAGILELAPPPLRESGALRLASASCEMVARAGFVHTRPPYGIDVVTACGRPTRVHEEVVDVTPFGSLLHFRTDSDEEADEAVGAHRPRMLLVAAQAGHFSTLLRPTVLTLLQDHDVYLTDWHNARDVPVEEGAFGFDDYVEHVVRFLGVVGSGAHVLAVCQPCPATIAAVAMMSEAMDPAVPKSLTLMAGPVDARVNPNAVNRLAVERPLSWFEDNVITTVPWRYAGAGRRVYPGFLQVSAFMSMNWARHVDQQLSLFHALVAGDDAGAGAIKDFYDEYRAVSDLPAEFYLETVDRVFQRHLLPKGELEVGGRRVDPSSITRTALLTVEGENDDICGAGQTMAAHEVCSGVAPSQRARHLQAGVGHYGVFAGSTWEREIYPALRDFVAAHD